MSDASQFQPDSPPANPGGQPPHAPPRNWLTAFFADYFGFILKNVIGWLLILSAGPIGIAFPGPGGTILFLVGFALVTFPGKRRLTARVLHGRELQLQARLFTGLTAALSLIVPALLLWFLARRYQSLIEDQVLAPVVLGFICLVAAVTTWLITRLLLRLLNTLLRGIPYLRRRMRPWLRRRGLNLLPPRRRRISAAGQSESSDEEILEIHERHHRRLRRIWAILKPWLHRAVGVGITILIFLWIIQPIAEHWEQVRGPIRATSPWRFLLAVAMFAFFLFFFRALPWRRILMGLGHRLPAAAATRIWSTSELARYLPGVIWQVIGRVYLSRPYGADAVTISASQALELTLFLLGNLLLAIFCLFWFSAEMAEEARHWLYLSAGLAPVLLVLLYPKVFYGLLNRILQAIGQPVMTTRLPVRALPGLLVWTIFGLIWQSLAVWILMSEILGLHLSQLWLVAGAYSLAWIAGFLAVWAPAGLGVRELVLVITMRFALPETGGHFAQADPEVFMAYLAFLAILLRFWTTAGELLLAILAHALDFRGALGQPRPDTAPPSSRKKGISVP